MNIFFFFVNFKLDIDIGLFSTHSVFFFLQITVGDLALFDLMDIILGVILPTALDQSELLKAHRERVSNSPKIKEWLETRPKTEM